MDRLIRDVRYAFRSFARVPGLTAVLLITLAVGTGANATVFSFVDALLFRPAEGLSNPSRVVEIFTSDWSSTAYGNSSYPDYLSMQSETTSFEALAAFDNGGVVAVKIGEDSERAVSSRVTGEFFRMLGVQPTIGRLLGPADVAPDAPRVAVIGHDIWRQSFGSDPGILGQQITLNGRQYGVVGVAAPRFTGPRPRRPHRHLGADGPATRPGGTATHPRRPSRRHD